MRIESHEHAVTLLQASTLVIDEELCLNLRGRMAICSRCADQCESDALELTTDRVELVTERCSGCGACVPACPAGAFHLSGFSPARFLEAIQEQEQCHLHCSESGDGGGGVVVPCYKVLDGRLLAAGLAGGSRLFLLHGLDRCDSCSKGDARTHLDLVKAQLHDWFEDQAPELRQAQPEEAEAERPRQHEDQEHISRRNFLRLLGARAASAVSEWTIPAAGEEELAPLPFYQGEGEAQRPTAYQQLLTARAEQLPWRKDAPLPWHSRFLEEACTACLVCGERCPTGALRSTEQTLEKKITYETAFCTNCGLCVRLCPADAIQERQVHEVEELYQSGKVLLHRIQQQCRNCGHPFDATEEDFEQCPVCRNEQELDDEWLQMLQG